MATVFQNRVVEGVVADFDDPAGFGHVGASDGSRYFFHCTAIRGGARTIAPAAVVTFGVVAGRSGRWEATDVAEGTYSCPVCGARNVGTPRSWEICASCGWEDDPVQFGDPSYAGGANAASLDEARRRVSPDGRRMAP